MQDGEREGEGTTKAFTQSTAQAQSIDSWLQCISPYILVCVCTQAAVVWFPFLLSHKESESVTKKGSIHAVTLQESIFFFLMWRCNRTATVRESTVEKRLWPGQN